MPRRIHSIPALLALLAACGGDQETAEPGSPDGAGTQAPPAAPRAPRRSDDPRVVRLRKAIDAGDLDLAQAGIEQAATLAGPVEGALLRARLAAYQPDGVLEAVRWIEEARRAAVDDPRVAATATEIFAWTGRLAEAEDELSRAGVALGATDAPPELLRAFGITILCTAGARPREGLGLLEQALEADPTLPFVDRAMGQAHLLIAKELAGAGQNKEALDAVDRSLACDPDDLDTQRMRAELLTVLGEWGKALGIYEALLTEGLALEGEAADLYKRAGYWAKINYGDEDLALEYLKRALELGLPRSALGDTHREVLESAAAELAQQGGLRFHENDFEGCESLLDQALQLDPDCLAARNFRGDLYHRRGGPGAFEKAAADWQHVITTARLDRIELPEPVHLKLARHQVLGLDDLVGAFETLEAYLTFEPEGAWAEQTRALLASLPPLPSEPPTEPPSEPPGEDNSGGDADPGDD